MDCRVAVVGKQACRIHWLCMSEPGRARSCVARSVLRLEEAARALRRTPTPGQSRRDYTTDTSP